MKKEKFTQKKLEAYLKINKGLHFSKRQGLSASVFGGVRPLKPPIY